MKKLLLCICFITFILTSCKKDEYIKNKDTVTDTLHFVSFHDLDYNYYLSDNTHLYLDATTPGAISYQWLPTNETSPVVEFIPNIYYNNLLFYHDGAFYGSYKVIVTLHDTTINYIVNVIADESVVYCPNTFTPDCNCFNSIWRVGYNFNFVKMVSLNIYDQQNKKVFSSGEHDQPNWDGTYLGTLCDAGNYYYIVHYTTSQGGKRSREGMVQLIR
jgi:gliding motility-associated-like protein